MTCSTSFATATLICSNILSSMLSTTVKVQFIHSSTMHSFFPDIHIYGMLEPIPAGGSGTHTETDNHQQTTQCTCCALYKVTRAVESPHSGSLVNRRIQAQDHHAILASQLTKLPLLALVNVATSCSVSFFPANLNVSNLFAVEHF